MKKFLFLMILVLATCASVIVTFFVVRSERNHSQQVVSKSPIAWVFASVKLAKPFLFQRKP